MSVLDLLRPNIRKLEPYRCARDDYTEGILLDANENTHGPCVDVSLEAPKLQLNRYPDPHQVQVKQLICDWRNKQVTDSDLTPENLYLGVGSDECIDTLIRAVCVPGKDKLLVCPPTYGMYKVSANVNDVGIVNVPLDFETFDLRPDEVIAALKADPLIKLAFFCSPGNPTAKRLNEKHIEKILSEWKGGLVVVDEAYIDFSGPSLAPWVNKYDHLVVSQTLSKSFGLAGLRCGICFSSKPLARAFNAMKAPYNISSTTSELAFRALQPDSIAKMEAVVQIICKERSRVIKEFVNLPQVAKIVGGVDANFVMAQIVDSANNPSNEIARAVYEDLAQNRGVVVRFRGSEPGCTGCLRISVGTEKENTHLIEQLRQSLAELAK